MFYYTKQLQKHYSRTCVTYQMVRPAASHRGQLEVLGLVHPSNVVVEWISHWASVPLFGNIYSGQGISSPDWHPVELRWPRKDKRTRQLK